MFRRDHVSAEFFGDVHGKLPRRTLVQFDGRDRMTWDLALTAVIALTGHERFRWLCSEDNPDADQRDGYRRLVIQLAGGEAESAPPLVPLAKALALHRLVNSCPYRSRGPGCGCSGAHCGLRGSIVSHRDCLDCVKTYG